MDIQDFLIQGEGSIEDKKEAWNYFQKAYEHQMKGELEEAVNMYKRSIESHPTAEAYTFLGWTYSFMGRLDEAIEECHHAIMVDPDFGKQGVGVTSEPFTVTLTNDGSGPLVMASTASLIKRHSKPAGEPSPCSPADFRPSIRPSISICRAKSSRPAAC